jgi:hypothetical protein
MGINKNVQPFTGSSHPCRPLTMVITSLYGMMSHACSFFLRMSGFFRGRSDAGSLLSRFRVDLEKE